MGINEIAKARDSIKQSLSGMASQVTHAVTAESDDNISQLAEENKQLKTLVHKLAQQVEALELRVSKLEGGSAPAATSKAGGDKKKADKTTMMMTLICSVLMTKTKRKKLK